MVEPKRLLDAFAPGAVFRPRDLQERGISRTALQRLCGRGLVERVGRGLYRVSGTEATERQSLVEACRRAPKGIVCLLSALRFHDLTTQNPFEVWLAIDRKAWLPRVGSPPLHVVWFSGEALIEGIERHVVQGVEIRVYSAPKTVADCFKYRNKIGLDVALEALRGCSEKRLCTIDDLWRYAKICRVSNVMRPYLESLV